MRFIYFYFHSTYTLLAHAMYAQFNEPIIVYYIAVIMRNLVNNKEFTTKIFKTFFTVR